MRVKYTILLVLTLMLLGCAQEEEKTLQCPAEKYGLSTKDFKESGWVVGRYDSDFSSDLKYIFDKEWDPVLSMYALCSYKGMAVKTSGIGGCYFIYIYKDKQTASKMFKILKEKIMEKFSIEQDSSKIKVKTLFGEFTFIRYSNAIIGAYGLNEETIINKIIEKIKRS